MNSSSHGNRNQHMSLQYHPGKVFCKVTAGIGACLLDLDTVKLLLDDDP